MGDVNRCIELVRAAVECGTDAIKFQFYKAHELCQNEHPDYDLFKGLEFSLGEWEQVFGEARSGKLAIYADVFGYDSFREACSLGVDGFKLHAADLDNKRLVERVAGTGKPVLLGIGGHKRIEIYQTIKKIRTISQDAKIVLMPGHQLFPTPVSEHCLAEITWYAKTYGDLNVVVGCADHIDGGDPLAIAFPLAAIGSGALVIEKHLTMARSQRWEDFESALEPTDFARLVALVRGLESLSPGFPVWTAGRQQYREKAIKTYFAAQRLPENVQISDTMVKCLRPEIYTDPLPAGSLIGKHARKNLEPGQLIKGKDIQQKVGILVNCRTVSTRLPQKALMKICGKETIALLIERVKHCANAEQIVLCTTEHSEDDVLVDLAVREDVAVFRGPDENVALRLLLASHEYGLDHIVRVTGDDLLRDIPLIDKAIESHLKSHADYSRMENVVYSCDTEIISVRALETIVERAACPENTEYLTWYLEDETAFVQNRIQAPAAYDRNFRITLDTIEDFKLLEAVYEALYKPGHPVDLLSALHFLDEHPEVAGINSTIQPKLSPSEIDVRLRI